MEWWQILLVLILPLVCLLALGYPIAFSFLLVSLVFTYYFMGSAGLRQFIPNIADSITKFTLVPIPLFLFMGEILLHSGIAFKAIDSLSRWLGKTPGRLGILAGGGGVLMGVISGSTMASTAVLGKLLMPEMVKRKYSKTMSLGPIMASGGLAMIIPPSLLAIIFASIAQLSVGKLLIAGLVPGLLMAIFYCGYIIISCTLNPSLAPSYEVSHFSMRDRLESLLKDILPLGLLTVLVLGAIFTGVSTPTEASALGAVGSIILAAGYRRFSLSLIYKSALGALKITGMTLFIVGSSVMYSRILAYTGATREMLKIVEASQMGNVMLVVLMMLIVFFMGAIMDQVSIMLITLPVFIPIIGLIGLDPIWFGILMLINLQIACTSPPFGMLLFVMKSVAPIDVSTWDLYKAQFPFTLCDLCVIGVISIIPGIVLWLPNLMN